MMYNLLADSYYTDSTSSEHSMFGITVEVKSAQNSKFRVVLTLLHSERPKLYTILAFLSAIGLKILYIFGF